MVRGNGGKGAISDWVDEHVRLGQATARDNTTLIKTTQTLLPPFIVAHIRVHLSLPHSSFTSYCSAAANIPRESLDVERIRCQISSMNEISMIKDKMAEISEQVKHLMTVINRSGSDEAGVTRPSALPDQTENLGTNITASENVNWEPCSPITSIFSLDGNTGNSKPGPSALVAQPVVLSDTAEVNSINEVMADQVVHTSCRITLGDIRKLFMPPINSTKPSKDKSGKAITQVVAYPVLYNWRKPESLMTQDHRIRIIPGAIRSFLTLGGCLCDHQLFTPNIAMLVYGRLRSREDMTGVRLIAVTTSFTGRSEIRYLGLLEGIYNLYYNTLFHDDEHFTRAITAWDDEQPQYIRKSQVPFWSSSMFSGGVMLPCYSDSSCTVSSIRTVLFMTLSSYLAERTKDSKYLDVATSSAKCINDWMIDRKGLVMDCDYVDGGRDGDEISPHLSGMVIEGLSVLADVTGDEDWRNLAIKIAVAAMYCDQWHHADGILKVGSDGDPSQSIDSRAFKGWLNRGLLVAYMRNRANPPFCNLVRHYINVQFNALLDLSRMGDYYGVDWRGPFTGPYAHAQLAAIDTFVAALGVNDL
ncbi:hypothetical protein FRC03_010503 [Tulasnella sp. 419]|nr:hypothetical protein FRC03_010503 [Tulasnella sp. 419]